MAMPVEGGLVSPHTVADDEYMAKQLPYLQERAPVLKNELLEIPSNAPSTLPTPPLLPGEVLRMRQHRVICTDIFSEPLVGVAYLTNFRVIFNGTPVSTPEAYEIVKEMQISNTRRESKDSLLDNPNHSPSARNFRRRKKFQDPRFSKFYIGEEEERDDKTTGEGSEGKPNSRLPLKVIRKLTTMKRSADASGKSTVPENKQKPTPRKQSLKPHLGNSQAISLPLSNPLNTESVLSTSAPNVRQGTPSSALLPEKLATLPRLVPIHCAPNMHESHEKDQSSICCKPGDSGFVSVEKELDSVVASATATEQPGSITESDVDFEKSLGDEPLSSPVKKRVFHRPHYRRPESLIAVESDSDSDTASDRYFSTLIEEEDDEGSLTATSPECISPSQNSFHGSLDRVFIDESHTQSPSLKNALAPLLPSDDEGPHPSLQQIVDNDKKANGRVIPKELDVAKDSGSDKDVSSSDTLKTSDSQLVVSESQPYHSVEHHHGNPPKPPKKPPRRKNKFRSCDSDIEKEEVSSSVESNSTVSASSNAEELSPKWDMTDHSVKKPKIPPKPRSRHSTRRQPPLPPSLTPPPKVSSHGQSTVTTETVTSRTQPVALEAPSVLINQDRPHSRISQTSSLYVNPPSANSISKRFTLSFPTDSYSSYPYNWPETSDKRTFSSTWSDPRLNAKMVPYFQYTHSCYIPLSSLHTMKLLPSVMLEYLGLKLPEGLLLVSKNFTFLKLYLHPLNTFDAIKFKELLENTLAIPKAPYDHFAFKYFSAIKLSNPDLLNSGRFENVYSFEAEVDRIGILSARVKNSQIWRITNVTKENPDLCRTYPEKLVVLLCIPDVDLIRGASIYQEGRFPTACWMDPVTESVLLRAAATVSERGQQGAKLPVDEAILHAIRKCNKEGHLFVFTEKAEPAGFHDLNKLTTDEARLYYYHNCNFVNSVNPPTFKSVRHSFNKLQAMILNKVSDDEFLIALDSSRWLARIGELLETTSKVCHALTQQSAHVLVCYEKGWDRTTQITSLAQLLCDPYYRTMSGFQVLVQKEWLWFGHPFSFRNGHSKSKVKVDGPVFLQWLDCVYQVMRQCPLAFEFNENLLLALVEHSYSDQFGTFLMNSERERQQCFMVPEHYHQSVNSNTITVWSWIAMMNSSNKVFYNPLYDRNFHSGVIYPKFYQTCLELWRNCFERDKVLMELQENGYISRGRTELTQLLALYQERLGNVYSTNNVHESLTLSCKTQFSNTCSLSDKSRADSVSSRDLTPSPLYSRPVSRTKSDKSYSSIIEYLRKAGYDPSVCHHIMISDLMCQGYLVKEGAVRKNWKKRWFVLDYQNKYFAYFESEEHFRKKENPKGVICLDEIKKVSLSTKREHLVANLFQIKTPTRMYNIKAPSIISLEIWMACLKLPPSTLVRANT